MKINQLVLLAACISLSSSRVWADTRTSADLTRADQEARFQADNSARGQLTRKDREAKALNRRAEQKFHPVKRAPDKMDIDAADKEKQNAEDRVDTEKSGLMYDENGKQ